MVTHISESLQLILMVTLKLKCILDTIKTLSVS